MSNPRLKNTLAPTLKATTDSLSRYMSSTEEASEGMLKLKLILFWEFFILAAKTLLHLLGGRIMPLDFCAYHFLRGKF